MPLKTQLGRWARIAETRTRSNAAQLGHWFRRQRRPQLGRWEFHTSAGEQGGGLIHAPLPLARRGVSNNAETPFDKHVLSKVEGYILSTVEGLRVSGLDLFETNRLPLMLSLSKHQPRFGENRQPRRGKRMSHANEPRQQTERITAGSTPCQHVERRGKC